MKEERCEAAIEVLIKISVIFHIAIDTLVRCCDLRVPVNRDELIRVGITESFFGSRWRERETNWGGHGQGQRGLSWDMRIRNLSGCSARDMGPVRIWVSETSPIKRGFDAPLDDGRIPNVVARYVDHFKDVKAGKNIHRAHGMKVLCTNGFIQKVTSSNCCSIIRSTNLCGASQGCSGIVGVCLCYEYGRPSWWSGSRGRNIRNLHHHEVRYCQNQ